MLKYHFDAERHVLAYHEVSLAFTIDCVSTVTSETLRSGCRGSSKSLAASDLGFSTAAELRAARSFETIEFHTFFV